MKGSQGGMGGMGGMGGSSPADAAKHWEQRMARQAARGPVTAPNMEGMADPRAMAQQLMGNLPADQQRALPMGHQGALPGAPQAPQGMPDPGAMLQQMMSAQVPQGPQGMGGMPGGGMGGQMGGKGGGAPQGMPQGMPLMGGKGGR